MRIGSFAGTEGALPRQIVTAAVVIAYMSRTGIEEGVPYAVGVLHGNRGDELEQCILFRLKDLHVLQLKHLCQLVVDPSSGIVKVSVCSINGDIIPDSLHHTPLHVVLSRERSKRTECQRMV